MIDYEQERMKQKLIYYPRLFWSSQKTNSHDKGKTLKGWKFKMISFHHTYRWIYGWRFFLYHPTGKYWDFDILLRGGREGYLTNEEKKQRGILK